MKIKKLIVRKMEPSEEVIREIIFNQNGLSLIVDNTPEELIESGNSVGKSTAIKIIDLCLGAKTVKELYFDPDTKSDRKIGNEADSGEKIKKFNQIFADYCNQLYGEKYFLAYDENWKENKKFPVTIASLGGNVGTGKKKAVIVAYDLAYMKFSTEVGIKVPQFVIHDKMENTHINQLKTIFEICSKIEGQYIIPILRERIDKIDREYIDKAIVLELSTSDKFFRI